MARTFRDGARSGEHDCRQTFRKRQGLEFSGAGAYIRRLQFLSVLRTPPRPQPTRMSSALASFEFPPEILYEICAQVYTAGLPPAESSLDPVISSEGIPTGHPSAVPPANWSEGDSRNTLASCCLINHAWYEAAKPWLWHRCVKPP